MEKDLRLLDLTARAKYDKYIAAAIRVDRTHFDVCVAATTAPNTVAELKRRADQEERRAEKAMLKAAAAAIAYDSALAAYKEEGAETL